MAAASRLFYGDNVDVLREHIASESVDLIYLDPPFNSNSVPELFAGKRPNLPSAINPYKQAKGRGGEQLSLM